jgi:hypothetical protein
MRSRYLLSCVAAMALVAGCGSSGGGGGVSESKLVDALSLESIDGGYTIKGTICGVSKLLTTSDEVSQANDTDKGQVLASKDQTVGIVILPPFSQSCARQARTALDKLAKSE